MKATRILALVLALVMALALAACTPKPVSPDDNKPTAEPAATEQSGDNTENPDNTEGPETTEVPAYPTWEGRTPDDKTLVVAYSPFNSRFSPFFAQTAYDQDAQSMTQIGLLTSDRTGAIITNGIMGETINFNGTDYTYYGPADLKITENEDGTVYYDFTLRNDLVFSDGEPLTVDDVIFSMYVLCDPTYDGSSTLYAQPILGMEEYRKGMTTLPDYLINVIGETAADYSIVSQEDQEAFFTKYHAASLALAQEITDYCVANYAAHGATGPQTSAALWGFETEEDTVESFAAALEKAYGADVAGMIDTENAGSTVEDLFPDWEDFNTQTITYAENADHIEGIQKIDDYNMRVVLTEVDATAIYQLGVTIAPMHYYGEKDKYDYDNNKFGFDKGDLSHVRSVTTQPMGAGPYKFIKFEKGVIYYEANEKYFQGCPLTKYVNFLETLNDTDKLNGIVTETVDISDPSFSTDNINAIEKANSNGELTGDVITTNTVDNLGYGYIGQNAINVKVGDDPASDASKNLRRAFATVFSVYRNVAIDSYYGDRASVINYPISNTSWAAPRPADDGYAIAFSKDVEGNEIYTSDMDAQARYDAALKAALGFFEAAGYTVEDGKLTAAPEGAKLSYTFWIPADGTGDHPSFMIVNEAKNALATIGMELVIKDLSNSQELWDNLDAIQVEMWAAAWGAAVDPDMYQIYYSDVANGPTTAKGKNPQGGPAQGGSNYEYCIADPQLDEYIMLARKSTDQTYRKAMYKACLDIVIDWAVETPVYQRQNAILFSTARVNMETVTPDITTFYGWMAELQNLRMN